MLYLANGGLFVGAQNRGYAPGLQAAAVLQAVPTVATVLISQTCDVQRIVISNTTTGMLSVTITDNAGTPLTFLGALDIMAKSAFAVDLGGTRFTGGVKWSASGSGLVGAVLAW